MNDEIMDSLSKLRSNANAARTSKRPERKRELMISIGLTPDDADDEMPEQMMGDEHEMMEGDRGMDAGVDTRPSDLVQSSEEEMRRRRMGY